MITEIEVKVPIDGSGKYVLDGEEMRFVQKFAQEFPKKRGQIIDTCLIIEKAIEQVILRAKRHLKISLKYDQFSSFTRDYTFIDKWKDFRKITKDPSFPIKKNLKSLRKSIFETILIRNKYAHGNLYYDGGKKKHYIEYEEGVKKESEVSFEIIDNEIKKISGILKPIEDITIFFDKTYKGT